MKEKVKWTPHIVAITALVVFIVLGLACASSPKTPEPPKDYVPPLKHLGLSQAVMNVNDPRIPHDYKEKGRSYWLGTYAPELSENQVSVFVAQGYGINNIRIDGNLLANYGFLYLAPGKHTITFSYEGRSKIETVTYGNRAYNVTIHNMSYPNVRLEADMLPGKFYSISDNIDETVEAITGQKSSVVERTFKISTYDWKLNSEPTEDFIRNTWPRRKYLEPYNTSLPVTSQALLETRNNVYIVRFDGNPVRWGYGLDLNVTIGVPPGRHTLQLVRAGFNTLYTTTLNCVSGSRYVFSYTDVGGIGEIQAIDVTKGSVISVTKTNEIFDTTDDQTALHTPTFDGPKITINYGDKNTSLYFCYLYISPTADASWGTSVLEYGKVLKGGKSITVQLPYLSSLVDRYDIMGINQVGQIYRIMDVEITSDSKIDIDKRGNMTTAKAW